MTEINDDLEKTAANIAVLSKNNIALVYAFMSGIAVGAQTAEQKKGGARKERRNGLL